MVVATFAVFTLLGLVTTASTVTTNSIDWCEYWARVGKKTERPECAGYELPAGLKRGPETFSCSKTEMYNCLDCEPTCHNLVPKCRKEQCNKGCVCKNGLARNSEGKCVPFRECAAHTPPKNDSVKGDEEEGTVMKTVKKMVPVIVNDVWKALFNSISTPDAKPTTSGSRATKTITPVLRPVEDVIRANNFTTTTTTTSTPPSSSSSAEITDEKRHPTQKGFYIDY